jgi:Domain of unknown function (DUF4149)
MAVSSKFAFKAIDSQPVVWHKILTIVLTFWLSTSLFLDLVIMPSLYASGMLAQADFVPAGYGLFWIFNRIELLCAAFLVTGFLVQHQAPHSDKDRASQSVLLSLLMLTVAVTCTYFLSPQMSALGLQLNLFEPAIETPTGMNEFHLGYWAVEAVKFIAGGILLSWQLNRPSETL